MRILLALVLVMVAVGTVVGQDTIRLDLDGVVCDRMGRDLGAYVTFCTPSDSTDSREHAYRAELWPDCVAFMNAAIQASADMGERGNPRHCFPADTEPVSLIEQLAHYYRFGWEDGPHPSGGFQAFKKLETVTGIIEWFDLRYVYPANYPTRSVPASLERSSARHRGHCPSRILASSIFSTLSGV
ncbi:MAG: hypothetical protein MI920_24535 [Kiloniellales bacterium]|nr:hypothetical protein [Kiloniellales bacterium]